MSNKNDPWLRNRQIFSPSMMAKKEKKRKWRVLPILWLAFRRTSTVIGAAVIISVVVAVWALSSILDEIDAGVEIAGLPEEMVLYLEINGDLPDRVGAANFSQPFTKDVRTLKNYIDALERAGKDHRVKGVYATLGDGSLSVAHAQEFRDALADFRTSGKFSYIYASAFDQGLGGYYLASAFDEMWMQPMGIVMISGISAQVPYLRRVLDKIGVYPQIYKRKEYKSAYDIFTESEMPEASRRATKELVEDLALTLSMGIAGDMGITQKAFKVLVDKGLYVDHEAMESGLIDALDYEDVLIEKINEQVTGDPKDKDLAYIKFDNYVAEMLKGKRGVFFVHDEDQEENPQKERKAKEDKADVVYYVGDSVKEKVAEKEKPDSSEIVEKEKSKAKKIALVYAIGMIVDSVGGRASAHDNGQIAFGQENVIAADEIAPVLLKIAEDESYGGVVLRVDSPGGSPVASETILRALQKVQESGKSVTVSMGSTAASGGYWIASSAEQIFVMPATLTGSIGVLGGKFSLAQLWDKLDVNWDEVSWGDKAGMWSMNQPYSKAEARRVNVMMDNVYSNFVARVAKGREMSEEEVEKIARGRVWSGKRAVEIGLADQIGGLNDALDYAAQQVGANDRRGVKVKIVPEPLTPLEQLIEMLEKQIQAGQALHIQAGLLHYLWPQIRESVTIQNMLSGKVAVYEPAHVLAQ